MKDMYDPMTGELIQQEPEESKEPEMRFDPMTGEPLKAVGFDPMTGEPVYAAVADPDTQTKKRRLPMIGAIAAGVVAVAGVIGV